MNEKEIAGIIKAFNKATIAKGDWKTNYDKLVALGKNVVYILGKYFREGGMAGNEKIWVDLFNDLHIEDYPTPSTKISSWITWSKKKYADCLEELNRLEREANEYNDGFAEAKLSYNNSSHRQTAVAKYERFKREAEKLFDKEKIEKINKSIHFLQAG
jgi:hypothetical protein